MSVSDELAIVSNRVTIFPVGFSLNSYLNVLKSNSILVAYGNTIFVAGLGTIAALVMTSLAAYPMAFGTFPGKKFFNTVIMLTMWFSAGLIPSYVVISQLKLVNNLFSLILSGLASAYNILILTNYFRSIPHSLIESAYIDGSNDFRTLFTIVVPLSKAGLATIGLWVFVAHWNDYLHPLVYMRDINKYTLQIMLREIVLSSQNTNLVEYEGGTSALPEQLKNAVVVVALIPVMCVYPFIQKYFVKGVMLGSVKE
ncbi:MAG: carbohydrate ABC transporter permease [Eubacteriales bacterium]|nr:carbohydrate ABC transporter permease [Eubacteriales bacterium]